MKINYFIALLGIVFFACNDEDKPIETIFAETERGAVLRTIDRVNEDFIYDDLASTISILIEEQSIETDNQFENVVLFVKHIARDQSGAGIETSEVQLREISPSEFTPGPVGLPRLQVEATFQEVIEALNLSMADIDVGDQFEIRMAITLLDGRSFSNDTGSSIIWTDYCFFKSPYRYVINVIEPLEDISFTGGYAYEVLGMTDQELQFFQLSSEGFTTITNGATPNKRVVGLFQENLEFTISGSFIYPKIYQTVLTPQCRESQSTILSGPQESSFGSFDPSNDAVFELDIVLDTERASRVEVRYRFTKQ